MATKPMGALAQAAEEPDEAAEMESPAQETAEEADPSLEQGEPGEAAEGGGQDRELFDLVVARALDAIQQSAQDFDTALKSDPVKAAVEFGTGALHAVAMSADDAGKPIPFEILIQAGMQVIKEMAAIANDKGYLPDEGIEVFLKEAFQQSLAKFTKLDQQAGKLKPEDVAKVQQAMGGGQAPSGPPQAAQGALQAAGGM